MVTNRNSISIPTSVAIVLGLILILRRIDPPFWLGCLIFVVYSAVTLIIFYKTVKLIHCGKRSEK